MRDKIAFEPPEPADVTESKIRLMVAKKESEINDLEMSSKENWSSGNEEEEANQTLPEIFFVLINRSTLFGIRKKTSPYACII